jgi:oligoendopeptidase F
MHPIELLKLCGIEMTKPDVVQEALDVFGELLKQW